MSFPLHTNRRESIRIMASSVVGATTAATAARLSAIEPISRPGSPRLQLSLAAYSFRKFFRWMRGKPQLPATPDRALTMSSFIALAADLGFDAAELTSYFFDPAVLDGGLPALRRQAFLRGISLSGTAVGNNFAHSQAAEREREIADVKRWIDRAALLGIPHVRVFAGPVPRELTPNEAQRFCIESLEACADYAGTRGVMIGLENHGGLVTTADQLLEIVRATRDSEDLHVGASTRAALALYRASQAAALVEGREYVVPDDVKRLAVPGLAHRVITKGYLQGGQREAIEALIERLVEEVPVPA